MTKPLDQAFPLLVYTLTSCLPCEYTMMTLPDKSDNKPNNIVAVDNQAAIKIAENVGVTGRTKHFSDAIHYLRHLVDHAVVKLTFVRTDAQLADGFTKPLGKGPFRAWCRLLFRE